MVAHTSAARLPAKNLSELPPRSGGFVQTDVPLDASRLTLVNAVRNVLAVALALSPAEGPAAKLLAMATLDPIPAVRLHALRVLVDVHRESTEASRAAESGLAEADPEHRLDAALALDRNDVARSLALDTRCTQAVRLRAFDRLALRAEAGSSLDLELLSSFLDRRTLLLAAAAFKKANTSNTILPVESLAPFLDDTPPALEVDAVVAFARHGANAEPALLSTLTRPHALEVTMEIIYALSKCGTAVAVEPLHALDAFGSDTREAARNAIAQIQSRLEGAAAGQLSVAEPRGAEGQLSVKDPSGAVSIAEAKEKGK